MNSYNDNLRDSVVSTLQTLQLTEGNSLANLNASMFTHYYAEGAVITADEQLSQAVTHGNVQQSICTQATTIAELAADVSAIAKQQNAYMAQSVTNTAVSAANIQVAANAIIRLAGDVGSMYSIVNAADFDSDIYAQSELAYRLINKTAYDAEVLSRDAMDASASIAEVSSGTVTDEAVALNNAIASFLAATQASLSAGRDTVSAAQATLAASIQKEKVSESNLTLSSTSYSAQRQAYAFTNGNLNLNLTVGNISNSSYTVCFNPYRTPFDNTVAGSAAESVENSSYPVKEYAVMLVKDAYKQVFTMAHAEDLYNRPDQRKLIELSGASGANAIETKIQIDDLRDADGDIMKAGVKYVVFVFARLIESYQKLLNNFDNYLSAPSQPFMLQWQLASPKTDTIIVKDGQLTFSVIEQAILPSTNIEYRVIYIRNNAGLTNTPLTDTLIAEQVAFANYTVASGATGEENKAGNFYAKLTDGATDNFGDLLVQGAYYIPAVLSVVNAEDALPYKSALSDHAATKPFLYQPDTLTQQLS